MNFCFHPDAEEEFDDAVKYYEECQEGLGLEFAEEVHAAIVRIIQYPDAWSPISANTRRCRRLDGRKPPPSLVNRFPYGVIYRVKPRVIHIIAVANMHRLPEYWKNRA